MGRGVQVEFLLAGVTDSSGQPLSGGKVYTYEAGTSTNATTYTNQAKTVNATNPIILGNRGEASIFASGSYKFVVKDSSDVTIFTIDGLQYVYPDNSNVYAGSSTGSSNAYVLSPSPAITGYVDGTTYTFIANHATSGAATVNISALGAKAFVNNDGTTALTTGDILTSMLVNAQYIGASDHFRLVSAAGVLAVSGGGTGASTAGAARTNLGLDTMATQAASAVAITGGTVAGATISTSTFSGTATITGGTITGITDLTVADGGTGASTAANARTNLGLGTISTQASSAVSITGGTITGITDLAVADGGTGASTAAAARASLSAAVLGANADITSLTAVTDVGNTTSSLNLRCEATISGINFYLGATAKCQVAPGTTDGSAGIMPLTTDWYTLGSASYCWKTVYTVGVLGKAGGTLTLASPTSQNIEMKAGNSTTWWTFTSAGKLQWASAPDYTPGTYTTRRSLDPAVATAQQCADAINTIMADLIAAGTFQ